MSVDLGSACFHFFSCQQVVYQDVFAASKELYNDISSSYETSSNLLLASVLSFLWVVPTPTLVLTCKRRGEKEKRK